MDGIELIAILAALHWSQRELGRILGCSEHVIRQWIAGNQMPDAVATWLRALAKAHQDHPPPAPGAWRTRAAYLYT